MNIGLFSGISAVRVAEERLDAIATNLANVDTPGFKRRASRTFSVDLGDPHHDNKQVQHAQRIDFEQGNLERTGNPLDFALMGPGFFVVEAGDGEAYTRRGDFRTDEDGNVVTPEGYPIAWERGRGQIDPVGLPITVDEAGIVRQGQTQVGQLKLVDFPATDQLTLDAEGFYRASPALQRNRSEAAVHQFSRERSNVSAVDELVALIQTQRSFESANRLMQTLNESYERLNREI